MKIYGLIQFTWIRQYRNEMIMDELNERQIIDRIGKSAESAKRIAYISVNSVNFIKL